MDPWIKNHNFFVGGLDGLDTIEMVHQDVDGERLSDTYGLRSAWDFGYPKYSYVPPLFTAP